MGMVAYLGVDHHMFNKTDTTCQQVNLGTVAYLGAVYDHSISSGHPSTATHSKIYYWHNTVNNTDSVQFCQSSKYHYDILYHHHTCPKIYANKLLSWQISSILHCHHMSKQVRVRRNLFVFRMFFNAANHSKQNTMCVWSGLYRVFLLITFESYYHRCTMSNLFLIYSTTLVLIYGIKSILWKKKSFFLSF